MISCKELDGKLFRYYWIIFLAFSDLHVFSVKSPCPKLVQNLSKNTTKWNMSGPVCLPRACGPVANDILKTA